MSALPRLVSRLQAAPTFPEPWPRALARAFAVVLAATLVCAVLVPHFDPANLIMVYMTGVMFCALRSGRVGALIAIALSIFAFDLVFVPPRWSLKPTEPQYYFTLLVMALVGLLMAELASRGRQQAVEAERERLRNTLLSGVSHDFRTPLTTIVGAASSLLEQDAALSAQQRRSLLQGLLSQAQRMHRLSSSLLDLTRIEEGGVKPRFEWCPAQELVEEALQPLDERLRDRPVRVDVAADALVWCDPLLLQQALSNLLDNVATHTPPGTGVDLRARREGDDWRLEVADHGPGLPPGEETDVFRKFHRGHGTAAREGIGLGLALVAAIARLHGGSATALAGRGTRIQLTLPQPPLPPLPPA